MGRRNSLSDKPVLPRSPTFSLELDEEEMPAEVAWDICYKHLDEFSNAPFKQFKERLADHSDRLIDQLDKMEEEEEAMVSDPSSCAVGRLQCPKVSHIDRR